MPGGGAVVVTKKAAGPSAAVRLRDGAGISVGRSLVWGNRFSESRLSGDVLWRLAGQRAATGAVIPTTGCDAPSLNRLRPDLTTQGRPVKATTAVEG